MAPVSLGERLDRAREDGDRAQLLLVGALSLAIALVAVALILNSAIYTHNLASRQDSPSEGPITFARDVRAGAGEALDYANRQEGTDGYGVVGTDDYGDIGDTYTDGVETVGTSVDGRAAVDVVATRVSPTGDAARGVRIVQDSGTFEPASALPDGSDNWTVARGVRVRSFRLDVDPDGAVALSSLTRSDVTGFLENLAGGTNVFTAEFEDDSATWRVAVYESSTLGGDTAITVHEVGTEVYRTCSVSGTGDPVTVDFTGERFGGEPCAPLRFLDDFDGGYTVRYYHGDEAVGSYELYADLPIDGTGSETGTFTDEVDEVNYDAHCAGPTYYGPTSSDSPRVVPALYATELALRYDSPDVRFVGTQRVAPGEPGPAPVEPRIVDVSVTDRSGASEDDAVFDLTVTVTDREDYPLTVSARLLDGGPVGTPDSATVPDGSDTATLTVEDADGEGGTYTIEVTVTDDGGNSRTVTQTHQANGGAAGCPP